MGRGAPPLNGERAAPKAPIQSWLMSKYNDENELANESGETAYGVLEFSLQGGLYTQATLCHISQSLTQGFAVVGHFR